MIINRKIPTNKKCLKWTVKALQCLNGAYSIVYIQDIIIWFSKNTLQEGQIENGAF